MPAALRLTVVTDVGRRDVVVPAGVRVGELVPELRRAGRPGAGPSVDAGATLVRADGSRLDPGRSLHEQLLDGDVLALVPTRDLGPRDVVDDPVAAVRSVADGSVLARDATGAGRLPVRAALVAASAALASVALFVGPTGTGPLRFTAFAAVLLLAVGGVVELRRGTGAVEAHDPADDVARRGTTVSGSVAVAAAGALALAELLRGAAPGPGSALRAGLVLVGVSGVLLVGRPARPAAAVVVAVPGALLLAGTAALRLPSAVGLAAVSPSQVAAVLAVLTVLLSRAVPWAALSAGRLDRATEVRRAGASGPGSVGGVDLDRVASAVTRVRELTRAGVLGLGLTCGALAPLVVATGPSGVLLVASLALLLLLQGRPGTEPGLRRAAGVGVAVTVAAAAVTTLVVRPALAPAVLVSATVLAVGGLAAGLVRGLATGRGWDVVTSGVGAWDVVTSGVGAGVGERVARVLEVTLLLVVLPLLALVLGLLPTPWGGS